jgi:Predicted outer membrane protein
MKNLALASIASAALLAACGQGDNAQENASEAVNATQDMTSGMVGQTSAATMGANTVEGFVTNLAVGNMYELRAAEVAQSKSNNAQVKELASMITRDHTGAGEKLQATAPTAAPDVMIPTQLDERRQGLIDNLNAASADDFDKVYLEQQVAAHNETLTLLNGFSDNTDAPALAALARELVAPVTMHRDRAQQLLDAMN